MTHADRTYLNLMIFKILTSSKARLSVKHIHAQIEPNMGISVRSLQRSFHAWPNGDWSLQMGKLRKDSSCQQTRKQSFRTWPTEQRHE